MHNQSSTFRLRKIDWDFTGTLSESRFSAIHWHPSRIVSQVPAALICLLTKPGDTVLDPFAGSGTTLTEAQRLGRKGVGIELNPIAAQLIRSKTLPLSSKAIGRHLNRILYDALATQQGHLYAPEVASTVPATVQTKWYDPRTLRQLGMLWTLLNSYRGPERLLASAAFSASLLAVCRERRHWGYVCDNVTPKGTFYKNAIEQFASVVRKFEVAYQERDEVAQVVGQYPACRLYVGDVRDMTRKLADRSVGLLITSPPYFGVSDYVKAQRLSLEWWGIETEPLRLQEIGARSKRHRQTAASDYRTELIGVFADLRPKLRRRAHCAVVIGESARREPVVSDFVDDMTQVGYRVQQRTTRLVSVQRRQTPSVTEETLLIFGVA
jgi:hypothetical protein